MELYHFILSALGVSTILALTAPFWSVDAKTTPIEQEVPTELNTELTIDEPINE